MLRVSRGSLLNGKSPDIRATTYSTLLDRYPNSSSTLKAQEV